MNHSRTLTHRISKIHKHFVFVLILCCFSVNCEEDSPTKPQSDSINKIMPLGASRVEGAKPEFESYRYELWKLLVNGGWEFDYIGTQTDEYPYEELPDLPFDNDHEGRGGWTSGQILNGIDDWVNETGTPDIVLFSSPGGNDMLGGGVPYSTIILNINEIIDILQASNPNITIVIEQLAPGMSDFMTAEFEEAFNNMQQDVVTIASEQTTSASRVVVVDMFTGFDDSHLADDVHYNEKGALFIASRYYDVLDELLESRID